MIGGVTQNMLSNQETLE